MRGHFPARTLSKLQNDLKSVLNYACAVFEIMPSGAVNFSENNKAPLKNVVIVGQPEICEVKFADELSAFRLPTPARVILAEIGMRGCRPYLAAREGKSGNSGNIYVRPRWSHFSLSENQYNIVASQVWLYLFERTCSIVEKTWLTKDAEREISLNADFMALKGRLWRNVDFKKSYPRGLLYHLPITNPFFVRDAKSAASAYRELERRRGLVRTIDTILTLLRRRRIGEWSEAVHEAINKSPLSRLSISEAFQDYRSYLNNEHKGKNGNNFFWQQLQGLYFVKPQVSDLQQSAEGWKRRVGDVELRIVREMRNRGFVTIEIFPKLGEFGQDNPLPSPEIVPF